MAPSARAESGTLRIRVLSAAVMLPVAAAVVWAGGWPFVLLVSVLSALMYREWHGMAAPDGAAPPAVSMYAGAITCLLAPGVVSFTNPAVALASGAGFAVIMATVLLLEGSAHRAFRFAGFAYIWMCGAAIAWLRMIPDEGLVVVAWLFGVVVATDTMAYFTGRSVGGPKLAPRISPKKTWSGLVGGVAGAAIVGALLAGALDGHAVLPMALASGGFAVIAQIGDLLVSKAKRKFDVKDSSDLIPGHGGLLDRLDGFLAVSLVMAGLSLAAGGSLLSWL